MRYGLDKKIAEESKISKALGEALEKYIIHKSDEKTIVEVISGLEVVDQLKTVKVTFESGNDILVVYEKANEFCIGDLIFIVDDGGVL